MTQVWVVTRSWGLCMHEVHGVYSRYEDAVSAAKEFWNLEPRSGGSVIQFEIDGHLKKVDTPII